jgi:hypothetical protein
VLGHALRRDPRRADGGALLDRRRGLLLRLRDDVLDQQRDAADPDLVQHLESALPDLATPDQRALAAAQVLDAERAAVEEQAGVLLGDARVGEIDVAVRQAADQQLVSMNGETPNTVRRISN